MKSRWVEVNDLMQQGYVYHLTEPVGRNFHPDFHPELAPKQMLELGVFGGRYMTDCAAEFPADWFANARLCPDRHDTPLNFFGVNASQPLAVWRAKGGIYHEDPRGWFQWYCRYYLTPRITEGTVQDGFRERLGHERISLETFGLTTNHVPVVWPPIGRDSTLGGSTDPTPWWTHGYSPVRRHRRPG